MPQSSPYLVSTMAVALGSTTLLIASGYGPAFGMTTEGGWNIDTFGERAGDRRLNVLTYSAICG